MPALRELAIFQQPVVVGEHPGPAKAKGTAYRLTKVNKIRAAKRHRAIVLLLVVNISSLLTWVKKAR
jgi:hypothetical protein